MDQQSKQALDNESVNKSVEVWKRVYLRICPTLKEQKSRLKDLQTWDTSNGDDYSRRAKIQALTLLINEK